MFKISVWLISLIICGWNTIANKAPNATPAINAGIAGVFLIISATTNIGTKKRKILILNFELSEISNSFIFWVVVVSIYRPIKKKIINVITKLGIVVYIIYLIWEKRSLDAIAAAKLVVSDNGDILSPKYAPEIIDPAISPSEIPRTWPIPINAIPIVAIVDQELPEAKDTIAHIIQDANKKNSGFRIWSP